MRATRTILCLIGAGGIAFGGWLLLTEQRPEQLLGVAVWMIGAVLVHDAVLVPLLTVVRRAARRGRSDLETREDPS